MNQTKTIGIVLIVVAAILLYFGMNASNAPAEQLVRLLLVSIQIEL